MPSAAIHLLVAKFMAIYAHFWGALPRVIPNIRSANNLFDVPNGAHFTCITVGIYCSMYLSEFPP